MPVFKHKEGQVLLWDTAFIPVQPMVIVTRSSCLSNKNFWNSELALHDDRQVLLQWRRSISLFIIGHMVTACAYFDIRPDVWFHCATN